MIVNIFKFNCINEQRLQKFVKIQRTITYPPICIKGKRNSISLWYFHGLPSTNGNPGLRFSPLVRLMDTRKLSRNRFQRNFTSFTVDKKKHNIMLLHFAQQQYKLTISSVD